MDISSSVVLCANLKTFVVNLVNRHRISSRGGVVVFCLQVSPTAPMAWWPVVSIVEKERPWRQQNDPGHICRHANGPRFPPKISIKLYQHRHQIAKNNFCVINVKNNVTSTKVRGSFSGCFFWMPLLCRVPWAPRNGTVVTPAPNYNGTTSTPKVASPSPRTIAHYNGTLQWHHVHSPKVGHPAPQPYNGTRQWHHVHSLKVGRHPTPTIVHNGTVRWCQQWHHVHSPKVVVTLPSNGTLQWHPAMAERPLPRSWSSPSPPTIAHYNGTLRWDPAMAPRALHPAIALVPRPIRQSGSSPSPPIGSKNPYSYRYLGKNTTVLYNLSTVGHFPIVNMPTSTHAVHAVHQTACHCLRISSTELDVKKHLGIVPVFEGWITRHHWNTP